ncbi:MAG: Sir2 silent information regulator family NAD-dependent deacetylase [Lachnoclostridium sp.]|nr:Sir2 silent information regulator family NAD-dependent deacetylase [Lachnospira sp.]MCM1248875.1 Sir2 silent information regulator family NAD-dependent deacetylase [Lachnoclostridium sp.]MCM1535385.1 Sir2 silent information regulator family NAD-dependent deacetylase [Clostridium sp.]
MKSTKDYSDKIERLKREVTNADAVLIGAGAGLSTAAGLTYSGERFRRYFSDFAEKYGIRDMYSGGFYPFSSREEYWAWWSRHIWYNRYEPGSCEVYRNLYELVKDTDYFVLTTNVDHQFQLAGFDKKRLFYTQGDYGFFQCSKPCHQRTYDNREIIRQMMEAQEDMKIPTELIPKCPVCGEPMNVNLRCDDTFVQDEGWYQANDRYNDFVSRHKNLHILYLEPGVGMNTPIIIKYPFWQATARNKKAVYACINYGEAYCPKEIENQAICIDEDIQKVISEMI